MPLYCETGKFEAVCAGTAKMERLEHLDMAAASQLNSLLGRLKKARIWNTRIMLFLSGGHINGMEPFKKVTLLDD